MTAKKTIVAKLVDGEISVCVGHAADCACAACRHVRGLLMCGNCGSPGYTDADGCLGCGIGTPEYTAELTKVERAETIQAEKKVCG